ncbi:MAG: T9SS type A sorting domain-containing protein, partial [Saprospiraceae bacterium]|nr:T9SS type A sorting domain-containing protein [Saprospiraceae bacterium]
EVSLQEAIDNGFEMTTSSDDIQVINDLNVYPNPALNQTFVELDLAEGSNVRIDVINSLGGIVASRDYGKISGSYTFPVDLGNMNAGVYQIQIWVNDEFTTRSLNVIK